jgi:Tol biopolymer transport system component
VFLFDRERRVLDALPEANHPTAFDGFPAISADGRFIVFESDRLGSKLKLFLFDLQGRVLSELNHANDVAADDGLAAISN